MRAAPALQITVGADPVWRAAQLALATVSLSTLWLWAGLTAHTATSDGFSPWVWLLALALTAGLLLLTRPGQSHRPVQLRWDGQAWHAGPIGPAGSEPWSGQLSVALDLGGWMLLHLAGPRPSAGTPTWLAVARRSQGAAWHPLRCAVYSPRPQRAPDAMEPGPAPHERP